MLNTPNYNLNKPEYSDVADIMPAVGANMDILDEELKKISDGNSTIYPTTNIGNRYFATIPTFALQEGFPFTLKFNTPSRGNITININNSGDKNVYDYFGNRINNVRKDLIANFRYDSVNSNFQLLGKGGGGNALPSQILLGATATVDSGPVVGTIPSKGTQIYGPMPTDQTIAAGQYLSGPQIIQGVTIESLGGYRLIKGTARPYYTVSGEYSNTIYRFYIDVPELATCSKVAVFIANNSDVASAFYFDDILGHLITASGTLQYHGGASHGTGPLDTEYVGINIGNFPGPSGILVHNSGKTSTRPILSDVSWSALVQK